MFSVLSGFTRVKIFVVFRYDLSTTSLSEILIKVPVSKFLI